MTHRIKQRLIVTLIALWGFGVSMSHAQSQVETWWAWTYDERNGEMIWLDSNGFTRKSVILPKPMGYEMYDYTYQVAVAPTGDRVAYTLAGQNGEVILVVYHLMNDYVMMTYSLPVPFGGSYVEHSLNYNAMPHIFTSDGRYLGFAYRVDSNWGMYVFDTQTNGVAMYSLFNTSPNAPIISQFELPVPMYLTNDTLHFTIQTTIGDSGIGQPSYGLNYLTGVIITTTHFPTPIASIEPRFGEVIFASLDNRFTNRSQHMQGIGAHLNSVQVYVSRMRNNPFPFYVDEVNTIDSAYFIQNGELIMLRVSEIDGDSYGNYIVIDRMGNRRGTLPYYGMWIYPVFSVGEGFVFSATTDELATYFPQIQPRNSTAVIVVETINGIDGNVGRLVYTGLAGTSARVVWAWDITNRVAPNPNSWQEVLPATLGNPPVMPPPVNPTQSVSASAPSLLSPQDNDYFADFTLRSGNVVLPPIFEWVGVASASQYALEFQRCMGSCEWVIVFYTPLTSYAVDITQFGFGQFRWRVVPLDANNNQGMPSDWRYFNYGN